MPKRTSRRAYETPIQGLVSALSGGSPVDTALACLTVASPALGAVLGYMPKWPGSGLLLIQTYIAIFLCFFGAYKLFAYKSRRWLSAASMLLAILVGVNAIAFGWFSEKYTVPYTSEFNRVVRGGQLTPDAKKSLDEKPNRHIQDLLLEYGGDATKIWIDDGTLLRNRLTHVMLWLGLHVMLAIGNSVLIISAIQRRSLSSSH